MPRQVSDVLFRRVVIVVLKTDRPDCHVAHLSHGHRELNKGVFRELGRDLVIRRQRHAAHKVVSRVGT